MNYFKFFLQKKENRSYYFFSCPHLFTLHFRVTFVRFHGQCEQFAMNIWSFEKGEIKLNDHNKCSNQRNQFTIGIKIMNVLITMVANITSLLVTLNIISYVGHEYIV